MKNSEMPFTLHQEGSLSLDKHDPGNWTGGVVNHGLLKGTNFGIAASSHPTIDIEHLTLDQACDIYWAEYVCAPRFDRLDLPLLIVVFDAGVNCGTGNAAKWLREAQRINGTKPQVAAFTAANLAYHRRLKTWPRYGKVWRARIAACQRQALLLVAASPVALVSAQPRPAPHARRAAPKAATPPQAGFASQLFRVLMDALFQGRRS